MKLTQRFDKNLLRLYAYFLPHKAKLLLASLFLLGSASMSSLTATLLGKLTDLGFYEEQSWVVFAAPVALIGVTLFFAVCTVMSSFLMAKVSQAVLVKIRTALFKHMLRWPAAEYQNRTTGLVSSKFVNEAGMALGGASESVIILVRDSVQVVALLCVLFWHNWQLTLVMFLVGPGLAFVLRKISKKVKDIVKESQKTLASMISRVQESYESERIVKISGTYDFEDERFAKVNQRIRRLALNTIKMQSLSTPLTQMLTMVAIAFVVGVALLEAQHGGLTIGEFITFLSAMLLLKAPIQHLSGLNATFASISAAAGSIFEMLDAGLEKNTGEKKLDRAKGDIVFDHVSLRYPGKETDSLRDICLTVKEGEHLALVGPSGAGKTSFVNLIPRFWEPSEGRITLAGTDICEFTLESWRKQIAIVSQSPVLFDDTIRANLAYGLDNVSDDLIWRALDDADLGDFVRSLPEGLSTKVGENGSLLSGGQKQRLAIAQAILRDAPILILDEATSALDALAESKIAEALRRLSAGRTCFIVSHRFKTVDDADRIAVIKDGTVAELGTHQELMAVNGIYAHLRGLQSGTGTSEVSA